VSEKEGGTMVRFNEENGKLMCSFSRRLDSSNCEKWEKWLYEKIEESKMPVIFNMDEVDYIASGFLRICIAISKKVGKANLTIINTRPYVQKVFKIAGLDRQLSVK
jgi:anti-anti-sigma factor